MSRIDDALRRLTGGVSPEPRNPQSLDRFASEGEVSHKADDSRRQARIEARRLAPVVLPTPAQVEQRAVPVQPAAPAKPVADVAAPRPAERPFEHFETDGETERLIDVRQIVDYTGFVFRSVGRHKGIVAATCVGVLLVTAVVALLYPRTYHVEVKLLAQRNAVMAALSNPGRAVPWDADAPTRAAAETVLRRDNLISLIAQTDLINEWDRRRPAIMRFKDWASAKVTGYDLTAEDKLEALVYRLENYMIVEAGPVGDGTVTIQLYWPDGEMAYRIVERARQAFLDARQAAETSAISESISILEGYSQTLHNKVNQTLGELARSRGAGDSPRASLTPRSRPTPILPALDSIGSSFTAPVEGPAPNPQVQQYANQLRDKREQLDNIQNTRTQELSAAQATLSALKTVYTPSHPSVQNQQQKVDGLMAESPQAVALKAQVEELENKYEAVSTADRERLEKENAKIRASSPAPRVAAAPIARDQVIDEPAPAPAPRLNQDAEFANLRLRTELGQLQSILERTDGARIELAVSEAAFKYRYTVIKPAQVPREPYSPNLRLLALGSVLGALLLAVGAAVAKDLISNRIVEAWQVERQLGLPILGSVRLG